jgi:hypothetical protein
VEPIRGADGPASVRARTPAKGEYFYRDGGLYPVYIRYVLIRDGGFQLVKNEEEFRAIYAPIESPDEALSYALAMRNLSAYYGLEYNREYEYFVDEIEDTHVETVADGYSVHLYHYQLFGCGPHNTYAIELLVDPQGTITQVAQEAVFKDPSEDGLCVD